MEALSSTIHLQSSQTSCFIKPNVKPTKGYLSFDSRRFSGWDLSVERLGALSTCGGGVIVRSLAREVSDDGGDEKGGVENNEFGFVDDEGGSSWFEGNLSQNGGNKEVVKDSKTVTPLVVSSGIGTSGGSRAGLFRTPISGGVQSATSAHGLPRPALAVRNLMEQARFAHLCTLMSRMHHRREGYPFGSLVDFAPDPLGHPIFSFSPLAIHTRNLLADPKCTLVVQIPGWSGLSNARVTLFGDVFPLSADEQEWAHRQYVAKHQQGASQQWGNFYYYRMHNISVYAIAGAVGLDSGVFVEQLLKFLHTVNELSSVSTTYIYFLNKFLTSCLSDIYFIGGFGTVAWVDVKEYETVQPDKIAVNGGEQNLKELNAKFSKRIKELLSTETEIDDAALISIDSKGVDIRVREGAQFNVQRISFDTGLAVETLEEATAALQKLVSNDSRLRLHNRC
ncbi:hypothetical protein IFM89_006819 [Coptis chinensis]|uniref:CREG-like beta-barrel domain-containing protein n=1 Tax=Coptis chinensis TaxID=261450 RepID=A0A835IAJ5_9MAGN|nr:hypothetical protein IFM89_006819 [Coptis chinensis]